MKKKYSNVILVYEDAMHLEFLLLILPKYINYDKRNILKITLENPLGAADKFVMDNFQKAVERYYKNRNKLDTALVVMIDADENTVEKRIKDLKDKVAEEKKYEDVLNEVVYLVPKRNVETWYMYFNDTNATLNEVEDYKKTVRNSVFLKEKARNGVSELSVKPNPLVTSLDSLNRAFQELKKL